MRLCSYALHPNSILFDAFCVALCTLCWRGEELLTRMCMRISYLCTFSWMRRVAADVASCNNNALSELARRGAAVGGLVSCGFRSACRWQCLLWCVLRWIFRWKDSNSGRTELDLGLVCSMCRVLQPEVCCVVLCYSLLALPRRGCWSEDHNLSFCAGRMENEFSANGDDFGQGCVWIGIVLLSSGAISIWLRSCSVLLFVLGRSFRLD